MIRGRHIQRAVYVHGLTFSATDVRGIRTKHLYMPLDLVGSKIMTVYFAEIEGRAPLLPCEQWLGYQTLRAQPRLRDNLMVLAAGVIGYAVGSQSGADSAPTVEIHGKQGQDAAAEGECAGEGGPRDPAGQPVARPLQCGRQVVYPRC